MDLTERRDLRGGDPLWVAEPHPDIVSDKFGATEQADIVIIGAGVMGAMLAERLADGERRIVIVDRRPPAHGSTAASTALVMWAADVPLTHLAEDLGADEAARRWRRVHAALRSLERRIDALGIDCGKRGHAELYLSGTLLDDAGLAAEAEARRAAGLPSAMLAAETVEQRFGIAPRAALLSDDVFEVDPVRLTVGLIEQARSKRARIGFPFDVERLERVGDLTYVIASDGRSVTAPIVILATGYERASLFLPPDFTVAASYAIASPAGHSDAWREDVMMWEASSPYLYARKAADGRIVAGGEDEESDDPATRDARLNAKSGTISAGLGALTGTAIPVEHRWAADFGSSPDGLPAIGPARNHPGLWLASGFGGNGVTFAALGAELIAAAIDGAPDPDAECFDPYRFG